MPVQEIKLKAASDAPSKSGLENVPPDQLERAMKAAMARSDGDLDLTEEEHPEVGFAFAGENCLFKSNDGADEFCVQNDLSMTTGFKFE